MSDDKAITSAQDDEFGLPEKELLEKVLSTTQAAIFWKDANRRFLGANKAFLDYYGFESVDEIRGKNDEEMGWHSDPIPFKSDEIRVIARGESTYKVHGKCMCRGKNRDIIASKSPMYDDKGNIIGLVGSFEDVTDEYRQRAEIRKLNDKLYRSLKREEKTIQSMNDMLTRLVHDMNSPINTINSLVEEGIHSQDNFEEIDRYCQIEDACQSMGNIVNDLVSLCWQAIGLDKNVKSVANSYIKGGKAFSGKNILLVEGDQQDARNEEFQLQGMGFKCDVIIGGQEGLDYFQESEPASYDLIIINMAVRGMDAYNFGRKLRSLRRTDAKQVPLVVMTDETLLQDIRQAREAGLNGHIQKPIRMGDLEKILKNLL